MIYIFGDSWGFSYKQTEPQQPDRDSQVFDGQDLACLMSNISNVQVCNLAMRGMNLSTISSRIAKSKELFLPNDTIIVLQTEPFRSQLVQWYQREMIDQTIKIDRPMTYIDVCEQLILETFYHKLALMQKMYNIKIIVHGALSRLDHKRAISAGLECTELSSTEIIAKHLGKDFQDNYFFAPWYTIANHEHLIENYEHYIKEQDFSIINEATITKRIFWDSNPEYFTHDHTTEKGSRIVAEYLCNYLEARGLLHN